VLGPIPLGRDRDEAGRRAAARVTDGVRSGGAERDAMILQERSNIRGGLP
jgi:hypothetical protein